jgi:ABC-type bacteriocin/lantibiotic exporter with double-glycine peptidase domain
LYDVLTSVEKIGLITDMKLEEESQIEHNNCYSNITLEIDNLSFKFPDSNSNTLKKLNLKIEQSEKIFVEGVNGSGKTTFIRLLSGLIQPTTGNFFINDDSFQKIDLKQYRSQIGSVIYGETPFEGSILDNITFKDPNISQEDLKWAIESVQLSNFIKALPMGLDTLIFPQGRQLSSSDAKKILLARSIIHKPKVLFYEDPTDTMDEKVANEIIDFLTAPENKWTIIVSSNNSYWKTKCSRSIIMEKGQIIFDSKK